MFMRVTHFKFIYTSVLVFNIFVLCLMFINFVFKLFTFLVIENVTSFSPYVLQIVVIHMIWIL